MVLIQAHSAILFKPIFWDICEKLKRFLELDAYMLQQCKLRVAGSEQEGTCRMHLGAKIERVKWKDSLIEGTRLPSKLRTWTL